MFSIFSKLQQYQTHFYFLIVGLYPFVDKIKWECYCSANQLKKKIREQRIQKLLQIKSDINMKSTQFRYSFTKFLNSFIVQFQTRGEIVQQGKSIQSHLKTEMKKQQPSEKQQNCLSKCLRICFLFKGKLKFINI
ncbi:unnamed protein product [Paramecium octaurelia]|uniref:Uncharacterized protein n=1 Tax=Paramecium octaurelia TaxID=43137 RepID=A0A8S1T5S5_PAROT|nr:unnamed protein product [Paramecium octaurelia]